MITCTHPLRRPHHLGTLRRTTAGVHAPVPFPSSFKYTILLYSGQVAACALEAALRGRAEVVPGLLPRLYVGLTDRRLLLSIELYRATPGLYSHSKLGQYVPQSIHAYTVTIV